MVVAGHLGFNLHWLTNVLDQPVFGVTLDGIQVDFFVGFDDRKDRNFFLDVHNLFFFVLLLDNRSHLVPVQARQLCIALVVDPTVCAQENLVLAGMMPVLRGGGKAMAAIVRAHFPFAALIGRGNFVFPFGPGGSFCSCSR